MEGFGAAASSNHDHKPLGHTSKGSFLFRYFVLFCAVFTSAPFLFGFLTRLL